MHCLADPDYIPSYKKPRRKNTSEVNQEEAVEIPLLDITEEEKVEVPELVHEVPMDIVQEEEITKEDYSSMLDVLKSSSFIEMMSMLSVKEAVIMSLRLGYVDNKYFSPKAISNFLGIEEEEVNTTTKKVLSIYKDNFNVLVDKLIAGSDVIKEEGKAYSKLPKKID